jgi:hypothetical protein
MARSTLPIQLAAAAVIGFGGVYFSAMDGSLANLGAHVSGDCKIKGNVSIPSGERIYHVPGQRYYSETTISPQHGERWFCSEMEAIAAGWRKSRV